VNHAVATAVKGVRHDDDLSTVGPDEYASPPANSSPALVFLDEADVGLPNPGGPTQQFRFRAAAPGTAILTFTHTESSRTVVDTVVVR
jgi:hypothetical protein